MNTQISPQGLKAAASRLPSSVKLIDTLYKALNAPDMDVDHVIRLLTMDTAISTRLLRMANTASYSRGETVTNIDQALTWLGIAQAYRVTCATVSAQLAEQSLPLYRIKADRLLGNSIAMGVGMEILAGQINLDPKTAYTLGMLQNLGRILLHRISLQFEIPAGSGDLPDLASTLNWEKETFGYNNSEAGAAVLNLWGLNPLFSKTILHQYVPKNEAPVEVSRWCALLLLTATVVSSTDFSLGISGEGVPLNESLFVTAGLPIMDITSVGEEIAEATRKLCEQSGLIIFTESSASLR